MHTRRSEFFDGFKAILPLIAGAIPFGIIYGAIAVTQGLSPAATIAMSLFVFAGAAQFIAAGLIGAGAGAGLIIFTTFIVNLRHILYAASLAPYVRGLPAAWLLPLGFWLTDESYAVAIKRYNADDESGAEPSPYRHWFFIGAAVSMYINWQICTLIGVVAGSTFEDSANWGLDFAMVVTFIGIVVPLVVTRPMLGAVLTAGTVALLLDGLPHKLGLMAAAFAGIAAGYVLETYIAPQWRARQNIRKRLKT
ncbi:MAG: branched-chain amino acid ABC transporter permease [Anaerolineaceae bacterium]|nr:MAG: branched-chain amino acid ABC transporter permease [Anaerolineaceae bacterium]